MTDHCAIAGTFAHANAIKTRSTFQLIIEIPIEQADHALERLGGWPQPGKEKHVAVMLLNVNRELNLEPASRSLAKQAGILCGDAQFQDFLMTHYAAGGDVSAAAVVRQICGVDSRRYLDDDRYAGAAEKWKALVAKFEAWK